MTGLTEHTSRIEPFSFARCRKGIIGYGKFGAFLVQIFKTSLSDPNVIISSPGANLDSNGFVLQDELVSQAELIILAVPIRNFESVIKDIAPNIRPDAVVMDVCSVKQYPAEVMHKNLPDSTHIIAAHPMFGPGLLKTGGMLPKVLEGQNMVMHNVRCDKKIYENVKLFFHNLGINIVEMTPEEHDRMVAQTQIVAQFVRMLLSDLQIKRTKLDTASFRSLMDAMDMIGISRELLIDMIRFNPYAAEMLSHIIQTTDDYKELLISE